MTEFDKMLRLLDAAWTMRSQIVPCLVGPPGIGKTAAVMQHAKAHGCGKVVKIVASRCVPSETVGMTMPNHKDRSMEIYNSMQLSGLNDGDILFLDELLEADQFVLSTLLTVIESREMADGTPLPDIQIIAATNDTILPEQLKGNIRQRFMFQRFNLDKNATKKYIKDMTGMDVPEILLKYLTDKGNDYNFLTPRSLSKLYLWMDSVPADKIDETAAVIDDIWKASIGQEIAASRRKRDNKTMTPEQQVRKAVKQIVPDKNFDDCTMIEMIEVLKSMPEWNEIAEQLAAIEIKEEEEAKANIDF